ncbi:MAG TPA: methyltransferase domain-containing protein [Flavisolibacter sp.]|nr:methyltransferase domain-containing protein [Flavisolibacter sp.]
MHKKSTGERLDTRALGPVMLEHLHRYALVVDIVCNKTVLDIACGEGYGSALMSSTAASVVGADADAETVAEAAKNYHHPNLSFRQANITALPFDDTAFDAVICFETLEHVEDHEAVLAELKRVLKPDGFLIISTPNREEYSDKREFSNPFHVKELTVKEFKHLVQQHFAYSRFWLQECLMASIVYNEDDKRLEESFTGDFTAIRKTPGIRPVYSIALAANKPLNFGLPAGLFRNDVLTQRYLQEERDSAKLTASYRLGHFLLWPVKKIFSIFQSKSAKP